jgi:hypothetical protein
MFGAISTAKNDLNCLHHLLRLPAAIRVEAGFDVKRKTCLKLTGERVFCFSLNRLRSTAEYIELCRDYGRDTTGWDRAFHYFINHMLHEFLYLVTEDMQFLYLVTEAMLAFWVPHFETFTEPVRRKG